MGDDSSDVDWLESPAPPVRVVARVAAASDSHAGSDAIVPHAAPRKKVFKHWSKRTNEEQQAWSQTTLRLREKGRSRKKEAAYKEGIGELSEKMQSGSVRKHTRFKVARGIGGVAAAAPSLQIVSGRVGQARLFQPSAVLDMALSDFTRAADVARDFVCSSSAVREVRTVAAESFLQTQKIILNKWSAEHQ